MIRCGEAIRLSAQERRRLMRLTGADANELKTVEGFNRFIEHHLTLYSGATPEEMLLRHLLERERTRVTGCPAGAPSHPDSA